MPLILYIDTSAQHATYLLFDEHTLLATRTHDIQKEHGQLANTFIHDMFNESKQLLSNLHAIAVLNGPGSYTGLRISLATAKGIAYANDIPLILINKLDLIQAHHASQDANVTSLIQAREGEYYAAFYTPNGDYIIEPSIMYKEEFEHQLHNHKAIILSIDEKLIDTLPMAQLIILDNDRIKNYILQQFFNAKFADLFNSEPFYLKNVHINKINKL